MNQMTTSQPVLSKTENLIGIFTAVISALLMGTMGVFAKKTGVEAVLLTFFRLLIGAGFMLVFLVAAGQLRRICLWPSWTVLLSGVMLAGLIIFYIQAMEYTTMANAVMMLYLAPLAASIFAHFFLNERLTKLSALLIGLSLLGVMIMMEFKLEFITDDKYSNGLWCGLLSMICFAAFILVNRRIDEQIHVYTRTFYQLLTGAVIMAPFYILSTPHLTSHTWLWLVGAGFFPGFLAILCAVISLKHIAAVFFGTLVYIEPITVITLGWIFFDESLSLMQMSGCLLIIMSGVVKTFSSLLAQVEQNSVNE
jgi:drug/metabolite transporter (DMT)-like permease